jgi:hypothetical protein
MQNYIFACGSVWVRNLVSDIKGKGIKNVRVFENRKLRRIFRPNRDEVTGGWRKLYREELHNLYSSPNIIRMMMSRRIRWGM